MTLAPPLPDLNRPSDAEGILNRVIDTSTQLCGARDYPRDRLLERMFRYARAAKLVYGATEVRKRVLWHAYMKHGRDFWGWS